MVQIVFLVHESPCLITFLEKSTCPIIFSLRKVFSLVTGDMETQLTGPQGWRNYDIGHEDVIAKSKA